MTFPSADNLQEAALESQGNKTHVYGGVRINIADGGVNLLDLRTGVDTTLDLSSKAVTDTPVHYITLDKLVKTFMLTTLTVGYSDGSSVDDLANIYLFEGAVAADDQSYAKLRYASGAVTEGVHTRKDINIPMKLDSAGRVYFNTAWTSAVINVDAAGEYFFLRVDGYVLKS